MNNQSNTSVANYVRRESRNNRQDNSKHVERSRHTPSTKQGSRWIPKGNNEIKSPDMRRPPASRRYQSNHKSRKNRGRNRKKVPATERKKAVVRNVVTPQSTLRPAENSDRSGNKMRSGGRSFNHLLNFSYGENRPRNHRTQRAGIRTRKVARSVPFDKEKFVQANYRFIVDKQSVDAEKIMRDPDYVVNWDAVEQVIYPTSTVPNCPICMEPPVCAKLTKCGHIFCWTCVMQYMSVGCKSWKRCPLCFESIYLESLKSLRFDVPSEIKVGKQFEFKLIQRRKDSVLPKHFGSADRSCEIALQDPTRSSPLHRVTMTENILPILQEEQKQLGEQKRNILGASVAERADLARNLPFIEEALDRLRKRTTGWLESHSECKAPSKKQYSTERDSFFDEGELASEVKAPVIPKFSLSAAAPAFIPKKKKNTTPNEFYYYQAADGQHVFVHGLNYRCLLQEYGNVGLMPQTVTAKVLSIDRFTQTWETRNKFKFLRHLPLTTEITICFLDINDLVTSATLEALRDPLQVFKRKQEKLKKAQKREEERRKRHEKLLKQVAREKRSEEEFFSGVALVDYSAPNGFDAEAFPDLVEAKHSDGERSTPSSSPIISGFAEVLQKGYSAQSFPTLPNSKVEEKTPEAQSARYSSPVPSVNLGGPAWGSRSDPRAGVKNLGRSLLRNSTSESLSQAEQSTVAQPAQLMSDFIVTKTKKKKKRKNRKEKRVLIFS